MAELRDLCRFESQHGSAITITTTHPDWTEVNKLTTSTDLLPGTYVVTANIAYTNDDKTHKSIWRLSLDDGATFGIEVWTEVKDVNNVEIDEYFKVIDHPGGVLNIILQGTKNNSALVAEVIESRLAVERKMT